MQIEIEHRGCRLKAAFPAAYTEQGNGLVTFDMKKVSESLGLYNDIVIGRDGQALHPLEGDLHFYIRAGWFEPEIWIEIPVQVGNCLSSWTFCITQQDWLKVVVAVSLGLDAANKYLEKKKLASKES
jgi:hypothetical protein